MATSHIEGNVAEIISTTRLIITPGNDENIKIGDRFEIIAEETEKVKDPFTSEVLEEIPVVKATVKVITVHDKCSVVENTNTREVERVIEDRGRALWPSPPATRTVEVTQDLPVGDITIQPVSRTIKIGDRCIKQ